MKNKLTAGEKFIVDYDLRISGGFQTKLFELICKADTMNQARLARGFYDEVEAVQRYQNEFGYFEKVMEKYKRINS